MRAGWLRFTMAAGLTSAVVLTGLGSGSAAVGSPVRGGTAGASPGSVLWTSVQAAGAANAMAADPSGDEVFAVGPTLLVAYDAATGAQLWEQSKGGGKSVAVSPDGKTVFVIKAVHGGLRASFATSAYSASTGTRLWSRRYHGRALGVEEPSVVAVSPGGGTVFVTGSSSGLTSGSDYATVAYSAASGKQLWVSRYNARGRAADGPVAMTVSPSGAAVYVTGISIFRSDAGERAFSTVAYGTASGKSLWTRRYYLPSRNPLKEGNVATSVAVSHDGKRVFVAGRSTKKGLGVGFATVAYAATSGRQLWVRRYQTAKHNDYAVDMLVSPRGGGTVIVAGDSVLGGLGGSVTRSDDLVVAYTESTGRTKWVSRIADDNFAEEYVGDAALSPDGRSFYLAGTAYLVDKYGGREPGTSLTVAANVATGHQSGSQTVSTDMSGQEGALVTVNPDDGTVYIGVQDFTTTDATDFTTVALQP
jgi:hypothetical protein